MKLFFYLMITAAILCGFIFTPMAALSAYIPIMILLVIFASFLNLKIQYHLLFRKELLITFSLSAIIMPLITYYGLAVGFETPYRIGLLLVASAPTGVMGIIFIQFFKKRNDHLALSNFFFSTFVSILSIPVVLKLMIGRTIELRVMPVLSQTFLLIFIPFAVSRLVTRFFQGGSLAGLRKGLNVLTPVLIFLTVSASIANASGDLIWDFTLLRLSATVLGIYLLQGCAGLIAGRLIGGAEQMNTLTLITSSRNCHFILAIATLNFAPVTAIPIILASIMHHVTNAFWVWVLQKDTESGAKFIPDRTRKQKTSARNQL